MEPRRTAQGEASREKILRAAIALFAERGYAGTSISAICERAGVVKTALYWHFDSKQGLLSAAIERSASTWIEQIQKSSYEGANPRDRLDRLIAGLRRLVEENGAVLSLLHSVYVEGPQLGPELHAASQRISRHAHASIVQGIEDGIGRSAPDFDLVAWTTLSLLDAITIEYRRDPHGTDLDRLFQHLKETIVLATLRAIQKAEGGT